MKSGAASFQIPLHSIWATTLECRDERLIEQDTRPIFAVGVYASQMKSNQLSR